MLRRALSVLLIVVCIGAAIGQSHRLGTRKPQPAGIAYWDLDRFYDTIPSLFYNDEDYTPGGRLRWTAARYARKVRHTAAVIDTMGLPIVALWGVENREVVRDIAAACEGDYTFLHRTLNTLDGMDFALLYYGDLFFPAYVETGRRYLYVEGAFRHPDGEPLGLLLCSDARIVRWVLDDLRDERPGVRLVAAGRIELSDPAVYGLHDATARAAATGRGNIRRRGGWTMRDRILVDTALHTRGGDVFARQFLLDPMRGTPLPTYDRRTYRGGYGYALPVFTYIE